jgi:hypothetical protein
LCGNGLSQTLLQFLDFLVRVLDCKALDQGRPCQDVKRIGPLANISSNEFIRFRIMTRASGQSCPQAQ